MAATTGAKPASTANNRRNHYRTLHAQPDAPLEIIKANYRTLLQKLKLHPDLGGDHWSAVHLNAAYAVLSDPVRRTAYDRELRAKYELEALSRGHLRPQPRPPEPEKQHAEAGPGPSSANQNAFQRLLPGQADASVDLVATGGGSPSGGHAELVVPVAAGLSVRHERMVAYDQVVQGYCLFCDAPHYASQSALTETGCDECASPLFPPQAHFLEEIPRAVSRSPRNEEFGFYTSWPGVRFSGRMCDLSPTGLRFSSETLCGVGDIIKIDTERLRAVGTIAYAHRDRSGMTAGVKFHTVGFRVPSGSFVSRRV